MSAPKVKAMVVVRRPADGALLVQTEPGRHDEPFDRPLGGHVEFGEEAVDTARREILEELGEELGDVELLGVVENLFELDGTTGHEIVFVFSATFVDAAAYEVEERPILDDATGAVVVYWRPADSSRRLVPERIAALLA